MRETATSRPNNHPEYVADVEEDRSVFVDRGPSRRSGAVRRSTCEQRAAHDNAHFCGCQRAGASLARNSIGR